MIQLTAYDRNRRKLEVLNNAFDISETLRLNALNNLYFSMPMSDYKNYACAGHNLVKLNGGEFYRIVTEDRYSGEDGKEYIKYGCEHVLAILLDTLMNGYHVTGNLGVYTDDVIHYVLDRQKDWVLDTCEFSRQFEYGWEQENLLSALYSIPNRFTEKYKFVTDASSYPYHVSLVYIDETASPKVRIRRKHNRLSLTKKIDYRKIATRLYPHGQGEGDHQVGIEGITGGKPYIEADQVHIDRYGEIEVSWTDRRYTSEETLYEAAISMLNELQDPYIEYETSFIGECMPGDIVEIIGEFKSFITEVIINYGNIINRTYKIANKPYDVASSLADLAERQRIEMVYAQGATQIYAASIADNCNTKEAATLDFYIDEDMQIMHSIKCKIRLKKFRAYSQGTASGGSVTSSSSGGADVVSSSTQTAQAQTSSVQAGESITSSAGGASYNNITSEPSSRSTSGGSYIPLETNMQTGSASGSGSHTHNLTYLIERMSSGFQSHMHPIEHTHSSAFSTGDHTHTSRTNSHSHTVPGSSHSHSISIRAHTHTMDTTHTHNISPTIAYFGNPSAFTLQINGVNKAFFADRDVELDITEYILNAQKRIPRGSWITIGILPNDLARAEIAYNIRGFIQSRGGGGNH